VAENQPTSIDLAEIRRRLANQSGRQFWRSLNELARTDEFVEFLEYEFPRQAEGIRTAVDRRDFLKLAGASLGLAGLTACTQQPTEKVVAYVNQPEYLVLGQPQYYATAMPVGGYGLALVAESHEYRPTKVEGNPDHPSSLGGTDVQAQASVLGLYDPDRAQTITSAGQIRPWQAFLDTIATVRTAQAARQGAGLRLLTGTVTSPTLAQHLADVLAAFPKAKWHQWEPDARDGERNGARLAFGEDVHTVYHLDRAAVVLSLDADVCSGPAGVRQSKDLARARRPTKDHDPCRLYVVESFTTPTGTMADHRLPVRSRDVEALARSIAKLVGVGVRDVPAHPVVKANARFIQAVAKDLRAHAPGTAVVVAGAHQPAAVHALAHAMNQALGAVGHTVTYTDPVEARPVDQLQSLRELCADMDAGAVECLVMLGTNPVLTAPVDLEFGKKLEKVGLRIHLGLYHDETAELCHWQIPEAHYLESWGDLRGPDGTAAIVQPLIQPLYGGRTGQEVLSAFLEGRAGKSAHELVQDHWRGRHGGGDFDRWWEQTLHDGVVADTAAAPRAVSLRGDWDQGQLPAAGGDDFEVVFRMDPYLHDGRYANNGWLLELPRPLTKVTWNNCVYVAPSDAERLAVQSGDIIDVHLGDRVVRGPVWIQPGTAAGSVSVHVGWGRWKGGDVCRDVGFDAYRIRTTGGLHFARGVTLGKTRERIEIANTQDHQTMDSPHVAPGVVRPMVRQGTLAEYRAHPEFAQHVEYGEPAPSRDMTLYPNRDYNGHAWGMTIDLGACTGCMACVAACVAENNTPVVGKDQILRGREMHWLRVDRYFAGDLDAPDILNQPVPCMQCENAPCELVCPVNATVHSSEGLNDMVYNRCVGTRYCSNNCPYKVRRFNYYLYSNWNTESFKMGRNPDVTVRSRGVMEKCTYCVQRIEEVRHRAKHENRPIQDGEIVTACAQACPTDAITFGDINDPQSRVAALKKDPRNYGLLVELNTRPRTTYLAAVLNPNPELSEEKPS
jgi:MoCo/4Fe-4S cofactor protein with predicted Tat translocation signal